MAESGRLLGFHHVGISVADLEAMSEWYLDAFGLRPDGEFEIASIAVRGKMLAGEGYRVELIELAGSEADPENDGDLTHALRRRGLGHFCLWVEGIDEVYARLLEAGATPLAHPRVSPLAGWRYAYVGDPEGNRIELKESHPSPVTSKSS